jgi:hypothetical protein
LSPELHSPVRSLRSGVSPISEGSGEITLYWPSRRVRWQRGTSACRIACCVAWSRDSPIIFAGSPSSPEGIRRTSTWPSDPVPPMTSTRRPVSIPA